MMKKLQLIAIVALILFSTACSDTAKRGTPIVWHEEANAPQEIAETGRTQIAQDGRTQMPRELKQPVEAEPAGSGEPQSQDLAAAATRSPVDGGVPANPIAVKHIIDVPAMSQYPEYENGCEITSLAMLSSYLQLPYDRQELIRMLDKDETPLRTDSDGSVVEWGDPDIGFVGDITGVEMGYGVYHTPIKDLLNRIDHGHALDLSGSDFQEVEKQILSDRPVILWTTSSFEPVDDWQQWHTQAGGTINATFEEHAVLLVGYDDDYVYVNNPLTGKQAEQAEKQAFIDSWEQLGKQAVTYTP
ncbi:C39 family peptidase [Paenibacillus thalictri]|nr:C39 family peptidase [Paenibacillus thalictri]